MNTILPDSFQLMALQRLQLQSLDLPLHLQVQYQCQHLDVLLQITQAVHHQKCVFLAVGYDCQRVTWSVISIKWCRKANQSIQRLTQLHDIPGSMVPQQRCSKTLALHVRPEKSRVLKMVCVVSANSKIFTCQLPSRRSQTQISCCTCTYSAAHTDN